jgi:hypothetical protein
MSPSINLKVEVDPISDTMILNYVITDDRQSPKNQ